MATNGEWLFSKPFEEQVAWMNAEHHDGTLDGDTDALNAKIAALEKKLRISWEYECKFQAERDELQAKVDKLTADLNKEIYERERYREKFGKCLDYADAIHALMDEGMA